MNRIAITLFGTVTLGLGAMLSPVASHHALDDYDAPVKSLTMTEHVENLSTIFSRADFNEDAQLDVDEYSTLMVVQAELARLNGFLTVEIEGKSGRLYLANKQPREPFTGLSYAERTRIDAVAHMEFYAHAGEDGRLSRKEFIFAKQHNFDSADRNGNGRLAGKELIGFAVSEAGLQTSKV